MLFSCLSRAFLWSCIFQLFVSCAVGRLDFSNVVSITVQSTARTGDKISVSWRKSSHRADFKLELEQGGETIDSQELTDAPDGQASFVVPSPGTYRVKAISDIQNIFLGQSDEIQVTDPPKPAPTKPPPPPRGSDSPATAEPDDVDPTSTPALRSTSSAAAESTPSPTGQVSRSSTAGTSSSSGTLTPGTPVGTSSQTPSTSTGTGVVALPTTGTPGSSFSSGRNTAAIIGGVAGALLFILIAFLIIFVYRFRFRTRRWPKLRNFKAMVTIRPRDREPSVPPSRMFNTPAARTTFRERMFAHETGPTGTGVSSHGGTVDPEIHDPMPDLRFLP